MFLLYVNAPFCCRRLLLRLRVHGSSARGSLNGSSPCLPWFAVSLAYFSTYANVSHACNASFRLTNCFPSNPALCSQHNWCCCDGPRYRSRRSNILPLHQVWKIPKKDTFFNRSACRKDKRYRFTRFRCLSGSFNTIWNNTRGIARTPRTARRGEICRAQWPTINGRESYTAKKTALVCRCETTLS